MEVPMEDLRYKMSMALNAADIGNPICEQAAQICAEIAEQHCAQLHVAGTGILHSEKNDSWRLQGDSPHTDPVHFVQMWVVPDEDGITPGYEQLEIDDELLRGGLIPIASGMTKHDGVSAIRIKNRYAALHAARLRIGETIELPEAPFLHLFVPRGTVTLEGAGPLSAGDAVRFTATGEQKVTATEPAEILVWEMHATIADWQ